MKIYALVTLGSLFSIFSILPLTGLTQDNNPWNKTPELEVHGYVDVFYADDFNKPTTSYRQPFFYNHNRHNEFNINNGLIGLQLNQQKYRATITLEAGTYAYDNYSGETGVMKNIYEAYAGISLTRKNNLWLDAGIFLSHLGFESPLSIDDWTVTRSVAIENLPYFLSGAKLTYQPSDVVEIMGVVCNGWQHIQRVPGNSMMSFGTQLLITPNDNYTISWGTLIGSEDPDSTRRMRYFNDIYAQMQFIKQFGITAEFDFGLQQKVKGSSEYDTWYDLILVAQYKFAKKWATALRGEVYHDSDEVIIQLDYTDYSFRASGLSLNIDFKPIPQVAARIEGRWLKGIDKIFMKEGVPADDNFVIMASIAVMAEKKFLGD